MAAIVVSLSFTLLSPKALQDVLEDVVIKLYSFIIYEHWSRIFGCVCCPVIATLDNVYCLLHDVVLKNVFKLHF